MVERVVCGKCAVPMKCTKTGKQVCYNNAVIFHGDEFTCPSCGSVVVPITSQQGIDAYDFHKESSCLDVND
jgi:transcription initiation factor IIE alpha subunit